MQDEEIFIENGYRYVAVLVSDRGRSETVNPITKKKTTTVNEQPNYRGIPNLALRSCTKLSHYEKSKPL